MVSQEVDVVGGQRRSLCKLYVNPKVCQIQVARLVQGMIRYRQKIPQLVRWGKTLAPVLTTPALCVFFRAPPNTQHQVSEPSAPWSDGPEVEHGAHFLILYYPTPGAVE